MDLEQIKVALYNSASQLPLLVSCLACLVVLGVRWRQVGNGAIWAALGLGLAILLNVATPFIHMEAIKFAQRNFRSSAEVMNTAVSVLSILHALTYILLFVAVLAGRATASNPPPPLPPDAYH